jgi:hypothetical protein
VIVDLEYVCDHDPHELIGSPWTSIGTGYTGLVQRVAQCWVWIVLGLSIAMLCSMMMGWASRAHGSRWGASAGMGQGGWARCSCQQDTHGLIMLLVHGQGGNMMQLCDEQKPLSPVGRSHSSIIHQCDEVMDLLWVYWESPLCHFV